nr:MAG TPA: hypothetical protein [Caudoviricetes sp.]
MPSLLGKQILYPLLFALFSGSHWVGVLLPGPLLFFSPFRYSGGKDKK